MSLLLQFPKSLIDYGIEIEPDREDFTLILPKPHTKKQSILMNYNFETAVLPCGTKWGKTFGSVIKPTKESFTADPNINAKYRIIAPVYQQALLSYEYIKRLIPNNIQYSNDLTENDYQIINQHWQSFAPDLTDSKKLIHWAHNGASIHAVSGENPDTIEGDRIFGNVIDEAAKVKPASIAAAKSTTSQTRGWNVLISTPTKGKNHFYREYMLTREAMMHELKMGRQPRSLAFKLPTWSNPFIDIEYINRKRKELPKRLFDMFYAAEFVDGSTVFGSLDQIFRDDIWLLDDQYIPDSHDSKMLFIGVDFGKKVDYTVFFVLNEKGKQIAYWRGTGIDYTDQIKHMWEFVKKLENINTNIAHVEILYDETGVGTAIKEMIDNSNPGYNATGITWNNANKCDAVYKGITSFQDKELQLIAWKTCRDELESFEVKETTTGRESFGASNRLNDDEKISHDDIVMAMLMANLLRKEWFGFEPEITTMTTMHPNMERLLFQGEID